MNAKLISLKNMSKIRNSPEICNGFAALQNSKSARAAATKQQRWRNLPQLQSQGPN
jgi:hypothetical protein